MPSGMVFFLPFSYRKVMRPCSSSITILSVLSVFHGFGRFAYHVFGDVVGGGAPCRRVREMSVIFAELFRGCPEGQFEKFPAPDERHPENELHVLRAVRYLVREIPERAVTSGKREPSPVVAGVPYIPSRRYSRTDTRRRRQPR